MLETGIGAQHIPRANREPMRSLGRRTCAESSAVTNRSDPGRRTTLLLSSPTQQFTQTNDTNRSRPFVIPGAAARPVSLSAGASQQSNSSDYAAIINNHFHPSIHSFIHFYYFFPLSAAFESK
jgi:hypothetical protein